MNAKDIQRSLIRDRYRRNFVVPNYTPRGWWECDLFELTEAGFFNEYEVKLTLADFRRDAAKEKAEWKTGSGWPFTKETRSKHAELLMAPEFGPSRFWYVVPEGLLTPEITPQWSGLIVASNGSGKRVRTHELKPAPRLHKVKADLKIREHAQGVCYWRMHNLILKQP